MSDQKAIASLVAQLSLDSAQFRKELDNTKKQLSGLDKRSKKTRDSLKSFEKQMRGSADFIRGTMITALGALGVSLSAGKVISYADSWSTLDSRLKLVSKTNSQLLQSQSDVINISNNARTPLLATAELYAKITRAGESLNLTQGRVATITETISKSMTIGGGSAASQEAALIQLNQALASGALRGEEFNSIAEQAPRLMQLMADALSVNTGELRKMAKEGQLTSDVVIAAIESQSDKIKAEFNAIAPTVGQSVTLIENAMVAMTGKLDSATGGSIALTGFLSSLAGQISAVGDKSKEATQKAGPLTTVIETLGGWALGASLGFDALGSNIASFFAQLSTVIGVASGNIERQAAGRMIKSIQGQNAAHQAGLQKRLDDYWAAMNGQGDADKKTNKNRVKETVNANQKIIDATAIFEERRAQLEAEAAEKRRLMAEQRENDQFIREWERDLERREEKYLQLEEQHLTDMETLNARKEEELAIVSYWESRHTDQTARAEDLRARIQKKYADEKIKIEKRNASNAMRYDQMSAQQRISIHQRMGNALVAIGGTWAGKLFKINQALSLVNAAVSLPSAVMKSFENGGGYPWGLIPAGLMLAEGLAQIATIESQSFDSGGGSVSAPSVGGGGSAPGAPVDSATQFFEPEALQDNNKIEVSISLQDYSEDATFTGKQVNEIIEKINDALKEQNRTLGAAA